MKNNTPILIVALLVAAPIVRAAEQTPAEPVSGDVLLLDNLGRPVRTPVESLPQGLRPRSESELNHQTPQPQKGPADSPGAPGEARVDAGGPARDRVVPGCASVFDAVPVQSRRARQHGRPAGAARRRLPAGTAGAAEQDLVVRTRPALLARADLYLLRHDRCDAGGQRPGQLQRRSRGQVGGVRSAWRPRHGRLDQRADRVSGRAGWGRTSAERQGQHRLPDQSVDVSLQPQQLARARACMAAIFRRRALGRARGGDQPEQLSRCEQLRQQRPRPVRQLGARQQHGAAVAGPQLRAEPAVAAERRLVRHARLLGRQRQGGPDAGNEFQLASLVAGMGSGLCARRFPRPRPWRLPHPAVPGPRGGIGAGRPGLQHRAAAWGATHRSAGSGGSASAARRCPAAPRRRSARALS